MYCHLWAYNYVCPCCAVVSFERLSCVYLSGQGRAVLYSLADLYIGHITWRLNIVSYITKGYNLWNWIYKNEWNFTARLRSQVLHPFDSLIGGVSKAIFLTEDGLSDVLKLFFSYYYCLNVLVSVCLSLVNMQAIMFMFVHFADN